MKIARLVLLVVVVQIASYVGFIGTSGAAETHVIRATSGPSGPFWKSVDDESSPSGAPITVSVNKGDILEVQVPGGKHGFVTLDKKGTDNPAKAPQFVWACGQPKSDETEAAAFRELDCGSPTNFDKLFVGKMRLEVTDNLKDDVNFWCIQHTSGMWGIIKLKQ